MTTPTHDETEHYVVVKTEAGDKVAKCECGWRSRGWTYHPRADLAGQRHVKEQAA